MRRPREVADGYLPLRSGLTEGAGWQFAEEESCGIGMDAWPGHTDRERADGNLRDEWIGLDDKVPTHQGDFCVQPRISLCTL